jgi:hypothetical protein
MSQYRAQVKVMVILRDEAKNKDVARARSDMAFSVLIKHPGRGVNAAKIEFDKRHGPDMGVLSANMQDRENILLYCCPAKNLPKNRVGLDTRSLVKPLAAAPR